MTREALARFADTVYLRFLFEVRAKSNSHFKQKTSIYIDLFKNKQRSTLAAIAIDLCDFESTGKVSLDKNSTWMPVISDKC